MGKSRNGKLRNRMMGMRKIKVTCKKWNRNAESLGGNTKNAGISVAM